jgi:hypothetical protein
MAAAFRSSGVKLYLAGMSDRAARIVAVRRMVVLAERERRPRGR